MQENKIVDKAISRIPCTKEDNFFNYWVEFLKPFNKLTTKEMVVLAELLKKRHQLTKIISDNSVLASVLFSSEVRSDIRGKLNISPAHFNGIMKKFKDNNIIDKANNINPKLIPKITETSKGFQFVLYFDFIK